MTDFEINKLVVPVWLIAISLVIFLGLLATTYVTGKRITWSPFGFEQIVELESDTASILEVLDSKVNALENKMKNDDEALKKSIDEDIELRVGTLIERLDGHERSKIKYYDSGWQDLETGESLALSHNLGRIPSGVTVYVSTDGEIAYLSDIWVFENQAGRGTGVTEITKSTLVIRAGQTYFYDSFPITGATGDRKIYTGGKVRVVAWAH